MSDNRREFLKKSGLLGAGLFTGSGIVSDSPLPVPQLLPITHYRFPLLPYRRDQACRLE